MCINRGTEKIQGVKKLLAELEPIKKNFAQNDDEKCR